jgi:hypothetical protein
MNFLQSFPIQGGCKDGIIVDLYADADVNACFQQAHGMRIYKDTV